MEGPLHSRGLLRDGESVCGARSRISEGSSPAVAVRELEKLTGAGSVCEVGGRRPEEWWLWLQVKELEPWLGGERVYGVRFLSKRPVAHQMSQGSMLLILGSLE